MLPTYNIKESVVKLTPGSNPIVSLRRFTRIVQGRGGAVGSYSRTHYSHDTGTKMELWSQTKRIGTVNTRGIVLSTMDCSDIDIKSLPTTTKLQ